MQFAIEMYIFENQRSLFGIFSFVSHHEPDASSGARIRAAFVFAWERKIFSVSSSHVAFIEAMCVFVVPIVESILHIIGALPKRHKAGWTILRLFQIAKTSCEK